MLFSLVPRSDQLLGLGVRCCASLHMRNGPSDKNYIKVLSERRLVGRAHETTKQGGVALAQVMSPNATYHITRVNLPFGYSCSL